MNWPVLQALPRSRLRILLASITKADPNVLAAHLETVCWQDADVDLDLLYVSDHPEDQREAVYSLLQRAGATVRTPATPKEDGAVYAVTEHTHNWSVQTFHWLAREKQALLDYARAERYDGIFLVDSDLLLAPNTLRSLLDTKRGVVSAVFWTKWEPTAAPLPQVWTEHPYGFNGLGMKDFEFLARLHRRELTRVRGLGACMLIRAEAFFGARYWPLVPYLPMDGSLSQGEDRHFSVWIERHHIQPFADPWPNVFHLYRPSDLSAAKDVLAFLNAPQPERPNFGDEVSFTIEPMEDPALGAHTEHVRGRLGAIRMLPEIERALLGMRPGDSAFVPADFPHWHEIHPYRGRTKLFRVKLLDLRSYAPPIGA